MHYFIKWLQTLHCLGFDLLVIHGFLCPVEMKVTLMNPQERASMSPRFFQRKGVLLNQLQTMRKQSKWDNKKRHTWFNTPAARKANSTNSKKRVCFVRSSKTCCKWEGISSASKYLNDSTKESRAFYVKHVLKEYLEKMGINMEGILEDTWQQNAPLIKYFFSKREIASAERSKTIAYIIQHSYVRRRKTKLPIGWWW